jgi:hypothetical protein
MDENMDRVIDINQAADVLTEGRAGDVSTVYWLGYDAPDLDNFSVLENERTMSARDPYLNFMQGLRATHEGEPGHLVAMGHSYGTTPIGEAARTGMLPVDDIVVAGSPGMHVDNAGQLMDDPRHVWAGASVHRRAGTRRPGSPRARRLAYRRRGLRRLAQPVDPHGPAHHQRRCYVPRPHRRGDRRGAFLSAGLGP